MSDIRKKLKKAGETLLGHDLFRIAVLILVVLRTCALLNPIVGPLVKFTIVWAMLILVRDLFTDRLFLVNRGRLVLYLFLIGYGVTALLNRGENFSRNIAMLGYLCVNMLVLYAYDVKRPAGEVKRELLRLSHVFLVMAFVGQLISLVTFFFGINFAFTVDGELNYFGMYEGRLWGIFSNPNAGSFYAVLSMILSTFCILIWKGNTPKFWKVFYPVNILVQLPVFYLCDSRASIISACVFLAVMPVLFGIPRLVRDWSDRKLRMKHIWQMLVICIALPLVLTSLQGTAMKILPELVIESGISEQLTETIVAGSDEITAVVVSPETSEEVGRDFGTKFGGRFYLWQAGVEIVKKAPLFGVGSDNVPTHAYRYAARYFTDFGSNVYLPGVNGGMHNLIFQLAASSGLVGLGLFLLFGILVLVRAVRYYIWMIRNNRFNSIAVTCIAAVLVILLRCMLDVGIVYGIYEQTVIFWTTVSVLLYFADSECPARRTPGAVIEGWIFGRGRDKGIPKLKFKPARKAKK